MPAVWTLLAVGLLLPSFAATKCSGRDCVTAMTQLREDHGRALRHEIARRMELYAAAKPGLVVKKVRVYNPGTVYRMLTLGQPQGSLLYYNWEVTKYGDGLLTMLCLS